MKEASRNVSCYNRYKKRRSMIYAMSILDIKKNYFCLLKVTLPLIILELKINYF